MAWEMVILVTSQWTFVKRFHTILENISNSLNLKALDVYSIFLFHSDCMFLLHWSILNKNENCWRSKILLNLNRPIKTVEMNYYYEMVPVIFFPSVDECQHFFLITNNLMSKPPTDAIAVNRKWMRIKYNKINSNWQSFIYASKSQIYKWCSIFVLAWIRVEWSDITV